VLVCGLASLARAGVSVSSYDSQAQANAYAPLDKSAYFATDDHPNVSPAAANVSGNWSGTNIGGSTNTWHMVTSANISTTTASTPSSLTITGGGGFSYDITTVTGFVDPTSVTTLYSPGAAGDYQCYFNTDTPTNYVVSAQLSGYSLIQFFSVTNGTLFLNRIDSGGSPILLNASGTIPAGQYGIRANASLGGPNLPVGINHFAASGSFNNFAFSVQTPEPTTSGVLILLAVIAARQFRRTS
jgi:hypothetical protein